MLRRSKDKRTLKENLMLASSTAFVAGSTNVAGVIAFLAFTTNITGHVANLARHVAENNWHEMILFFVWLLLFFMGAFISNFLIRSASDKSNYWAHSRPIIIEIIILIFVAIYGDKFYAESQTEREIIICAIIFSMGLQNSMVSTVSGGLIKSSHLTGLFTDLGGDVSEWFHTAGKKRDIVKSHIRAANYSRILFFRWIGRRLLFQCLWIRDILLYPCNFAYDIILRSFKCCIAQTISPLLITRKSINLQSK